MRPKNVLSIDMRTLYKKRDREVERILAGKTSVEPDHEDLCRLVEELRRAIPAEAVPSQVEAAHLALIAEAAHLESAENRPPERADAPVVLDRPRARVKERASMPRRLLAATATKVVAVALGMFVVFGGVAAAGVLPDRVQSAVSHAAKAFGIHIPDGSTAADAPAVPDDVMLPEQADVPTSAPPGGAAPGESAVPDEVTLPDQARVPESVPPVTVPGTVATSLPPVTVPETVPTSLPPVTVPETVPTSLPPVTVPGTVPPLPH
jgi:hypothetical protein